MERAKVLGALGLVDVSFPPSLKATGDEHRCHDDDRVERCLKERFMKMQRAQTGRVTGERHNDPKK
jgi:hypothetical protein